MNRILLELAGSVKSEACRKDDVTLEHVILEALSHLEQRMHVDMDELDGIVTGVDYEVTEAMRRVVDERYDDLDVKHFFPKINKIREEDNVPYDEAWQSGFEWRNLQLLDPNEDSDYPAVDFVVRVGDASNSLQQMLKMAGNKNVPAVNLQVDNLVDRDVAYGGSTADSAGDTASEEVAG